MYNFKVIKYSPVTVFQFSYDSSNAQLNVHNASHCSYSFRATNSIAIPLRCS
jgi:hypothetical protein